MFGSETPRTDRKEYRTDIDETSVPAEFARELEMEREDVKDRLEQAIAGLKEISVWSEEDENNPEICRMQWRGCVAIASLILKKIERI